MSAGLTPGVELAGRRAPDHHTLAQHSTHSPGLAPAWCSDASTPAQLNPLLLARNRTCIRDAKAAVCQQSAQLSSEQQGALQALGEMYQKSFVLTQRGRGGRIRASWERQTVIARRLAG